MNVPFQFTHPGYLLLLPPALAAAWWAGRGSLANLTRTRRIIANTVRVIVLVLLAFALSGFQLVHSRFALSTVFVLDASASVPQEKQKDALRYISEACKNMRKDDTAALVVFGSDAYIELPPTAAPKVTRIYSTPSPTYTDLAAALRLAMASFSQGAGRQIVVLSDGNENLGNAVDQALICKTSDVAINTVALRSEVKSEALLDQATAPTEVKQGEPFDIKLVTSATAPATGRVRIFRNGSYVGEKPVHLLPGKSLLTIPQSIEKPGFYSYEARLEAGPDTITENNRALTLVQVRGKPRVLVVAADKELEKPLAQALKGHDIDVSLQNRAGIPTSLPEWRNWDAVAFADIGATDMAPEQMLMIQNYVRNLGGGFGMIGGENSFGAGGYFKTPVEETLPVDMAIRKQKVFPSLAVLLIMDTSGSSGMPIDGKTMVQLEAESAVQVVETMQAIDQLGVIVSGEGVDIIAPVRPAANKSAIIRDVRRMAPGGGGIYCLPSMERAYQIMRKVKARTKHIIMLADGSDCDEQEGCAAIAAQMKREKMTFSTVSFGIGPHTPFLAEVAKYGGGKFYAATRARDLPRIFTKDAMLASKSLIVEESFRPKVDLTAEVLRGIDFSAVPPLLGYVATTPKSLADVPLQTHKDDPLLATWRYGLGRSVAFTSDAHARWSAHWLGWPGYGKLWSQAMRWMLKRGHPENWQTTVEQTRGIGKITVEAIDEQAGFVNFLNLNAHIVKPDMSAETVRLEQTAPGRYSASFPVRSVGAYMVTVAREGKGGGATQTAGIVVPYPPEYKDLKPNEALLTQLADTTGGRSEPEPGSIYGSERKAARLPQDVWWLLVLMAAIIWPVDVAVRRLMIERAQVDTALAWVRGHATDGWDAVRTTLRPRHVQDQTTGQLLENQQRRKVVKAKPGFDPEALANLTAPAPPAGGDDEERRQPATVTTEVRPPRVEVTSRMQAPQTEVKPSAPTEEQADAISRLKSAKRRAKTKNEE